jgi:acetylornithine deacetylase
MHSPQEAWLKTLVGFDTTSRLSNLALIEHVEAYLDAHHIPHHRLPNDDGSKACLIATIAASDGESMAGGIVLSGHTDVVPVDGQPWNSNPFLLTDKDDGLLYGRGTCDMKGFIACALAMVPEWVENPPPCPIHFAFSYDEEVGCLAAAPLSAHLNALGISPALVLIGEPTSMRVVDAHKGIRSFETTVSGLEAHSSNTHLGVNAVQIAAELIHKLTSIAARFRELGDDSGRFDPPFTTVHVGVIHGGTARNIIPRECKFLWEVRPLPQHNPDDVLAEFLAHAEEVIAPYRAVFEDASVVTRAVSTVLGLHPMQPQPLLSALLHLAGSNGCNAVSFGTEGGIFQAAGFPVLVCGPGDIAQAHSPNEFIAKSQLADCVDFLRALPPLVATHS